MHQYDSSRTGNYTPAAGIMGTSPTLLWNYTTGSYVRSSPTIVNGVLYIGSADKNLYALNATTGAKLWNYTTGSDIRYSGPAVANGSVYVMDHTVATTFYALNATTGAEQWTTLSLGDSSPAVTDDGVYFVQDANLTAVDATTGSELWSFRPSSSSADIDGSDPAVSGDVVYIGGTNHKLYALNASNGTVIWSNSTEAGISNTPSVANGVVYISDWSKIYAFDATTGVILWNTTDDMSGTDAAIANGVVYVGSNYDMYAFNAATGAKLWNYTTGDYVYCPSVAKGVVYFGSADKNLYALNALTGAKLWNYTINSTITNSPAIADGVVYFGSEEGKVYALNTLAAPVAAFSATPTFITIPNTVQFTDTSTGPPTAWLWNFGDGDSTNSTVQNPVHTYSTAGIYTVSLNATNSVGSNISIRTNYITATVPKPVASFTSNLSWGNAPLTVQFTDTSTNTPAGWAWYFGDERYNQTWTEVNASAGWPGRFEHGIVTMPDGNLVVMGGFNETNVPFHDVWQSTDYGATWTEVTPAAEWEPRSSFASLVMPNGSIIVIGGASDTAFYNDVWISTNNGRNWTEVNASSGWSKRGSVSAVAMPDNSIVLMGGDGPSAKNDTWQSTDYGATWTLLNASSGWSKRGSVAAVAMPDSSIVLMGGDDGSVKNDTWQSTDYGATWTLLNASSGWSARQQHTVVAMPDNSIVLMGGYDGSVKNDTWRSKDNGRSWTQISEHAGWTARGYHESILIPDGSIILTGGIDTTATNDVWRFQPAGSSLQDPVHSYTSVGNYSVALLARNAGGWSNTLKSLYINVTSDIVPVASFTSNVTSGIAPLTVQFNDTSTNSPTSWYWDFHDGTPVSKLQNPVHAFSFAGTYRVYFNATNAAGSSDDSHPVFVDFASVNMFRGNRFHTGIFDDNGTRPTANLKWKVTTGAAVGSSPVIANDKLYFGSNDGKISAVNASNGWPVWNTSIGTNIESTPAIADGIVYIGSWNKNVYALDAVTGSSVWTYTTGDCITSSPAVENGIVYIGSKDGKIYALNATNGIPYWIYNTGSTVGSSPAIKNGIVYVGSGVSAIHALNATTGTVIWTNTSLAGQVISSPAVANGIVYVGSYNNKIYAIHADTGAPLWEYTTTGTVDSSPAVSGDIVYIGSDDKNLYALGATNGTKLWNYATSGIIKSSPSVANGRVYIGSNDNTLYVLNSTSGSVLMQYTVSGAVRSSPWIANGTVYFSSDDFSIYALGGPGTAPVASFTLNVTHGIAPLDVQFTDSSTNTPTSWNWSFGDGTPFSTLQNPIHSFSFPGKYNVTLNATNTAGFNTTIDTIYISDIVADFTWSCNTTIPYRVDFRNTSTTSYPPIESLWWYFGDGDSDLPETANPMHTYTNTSSMNVTLKVWDLLGVESDISKMVTPCSLTPAANGTIINQSATLFIGEEGLNITHALNQAAGTSDINGVPYFTTIGWWSSTSTVGVTAPDYTIDMSTRYKSLLVSPVEFVGRTGNWYLLDSHYDPITPAIFTVADPSLDVRIWDFDHTSDVTGSSVSQGTRLGFRIDTNMNQIVNNRSPLHYATDGFINISVKNASGTTFTTLYNDSTSTGATRAGPHTILANFVNTQPFYWGAPSGYSWATGALDATDTSLYPPGTYTVTATSTLHNMLDNYRTSGGAAYTGKTVSLSRTVTIASAPAPVVSFTSDATNGTVPFTVHFTDTSAGSPVAWNWSFGDGNYSNVQNPAHTFVLPKVHNITLIATFSSVLSNSTTQQITAYAQNVATTSAVNGTTSSTVAGNQTMIVNTSAITDTGGTVTSSGNTITITGGNTFWQNTQIEAASIATNETTGNFTAANVTQVIMQSSPVTANLNETFSNISVSLDVALKQYIPDADINIAITQGATTDTTHAFQLAAQNASRSISDIAYTVQFSNTELINSNLTTNAARSSNAVVLNMSVNHSWVAQFDTGSNNFGRDAIAIIRYPETGNPKSLPTRFTFFDPSTNLDWFTADSPDGLSIFGMVGYAAQQAAAQQAAPPSGSLVRETPQTMDTPTAVTPEKTPTKPTVTSTPLPSKPPTPAIPAYMTTAPLKTDVSGQLTSPVQLKSADQAALLSLPQGTKTTDSSGHALSEITLQELDTSAVPPAESSTYSFSGLAYQCKPDGSQFSPAITITFKPTESQWSSLTATGLQPVIRTYSSGAWQSLTTTSDTSSKTLSAQVSHFSSFAVFSEPATALGTGSGSSAAAPTPTKTNAKPPANAFEIMINLGSWCLEFIMKNFILTIAGIILLGLGYAGWSRYRRKKQYDFLMYGKR